MKVSSIFNLLSVRISNMFFPRLLFQFWILMTVNIGHLDHEIEGWILFDYIFLGNKKMAD